MVNYLIKIPGLIQSGWAKYKPLVFGWKKMKTRRIILSLILILIVSALGIFVFGAGNAKAITIENIRIPIFGNIVSTFLEATLWMLTKLLYYAARLADAILGITQFTKASVVTIGWTVVRDLANMFFVFILLAIALATILKLETYGMKALLPKLIIAALLINFSLVIAGVIIDFAQVLTNFFIQQAAAGENVSIAIMDGLMLQKLYEHDKSIWQKFIDDLRPFKKFMGPTVLQMADRFFGIIIVLVATFTFFLFAFFLLIRIVILWFLLILSPIVWLFWILPATRTWWTRWWTMFLKWTFFAPIYGFFLYITLLTIQRGAITAEITKGIKFAEGAAFSSVFASNPQIILQYVLLIAMLIGGLIAAQSMGAYGAAGAIRFAKGAGQRASGIKAIQRWQKARTSAREDEAKERRKRLLRMGQVGGIGQWARERLRPTAKGRAEARARKNAEVVKEAQRLGETMDWKTVQKIAGKRTPSLTRGARVQKLAAQTLLTNPGNLKSAYNKMLHRSVSMTPPIGGWKYRRLRALTNRVNKILIKKRAKGKYTRYEHA